jgi:hypothetical protein
MKRKLETLFIAILLIILAIVCADGFELPRPPAAKKKVILQSPKAKGEMVNASMAVIVMPKDKYLIWTYPVPLPSPLYEFDVEIRGDLTQPWVKFATVSGPPVKIMPGFFRVGAHRKI